MRVQSKMYNRRGYMYRSGLAMGKRAALSGATAVSRLDLRAAVLGMLSHSIHRDCDCAPRPPSSSQQHPPTPPHRRKSFGELGSASQCHSSSFPYRSILVRSAPPIEAPATAGRPPRAARAGHGAVGSHRMPPLYRTISTIYQYS